MIEDSYELNRAYDRSISSNFGESQVLHLRLRVIKSDDDVNHFVIKDEKVFAVGGGYGGEIKKLRLPSIKRLAVTNYDEFFIDTGVL